MQTSNSTGQDTRYTIETGRGPGPIRTTLKLIGSALKSSNELGPYSYAASLNGGAAGRVSFFVQEGEEWVFAASGEFKDSSALVTLVGVPGDYRVEIAYPQVA